MTFFSDSRRRLMVGGAAFGLGMAVAPMAVRAQQGGAAQLGPADPAEIQQLIAEFLQDTQPTEEGLKLDLPILGDNPSSVPVRVILEQPVTPESWCEEIIIVAEGNPRPLACRFHLTPLMGNVDVGVRLRLIDSQTVRAMARMNDGRVLSKAQHITVTAGGCGM